MPQVSCIIPAYNEAPRIENVLKAVEGHPLIHEVIVVDDASKDATTAVLEKHPAVKILRMPQNGGKTMAVHAGLQAAKGDIVLLLDADLIGITAKNVSDLLEPVLSGKAQVSISLRGNTPWRPIGIDYISGERAFHKTLLTNELSHLPRLPRFGLEVFLNSIIVNRKVPIAIVPWLNVASPFKYKKAGLLKGFTGDAAMVMNIFRVISPWGALRQIVAMRRLSVH